MKPRLPIKTTLFILAATASGATLASNSVMVRIPSKLAATIAQQSFGQPAESGNSQITLNVKTLTPVVKKINVAKVGEAIRTYGGSLFGLNFDRPFKLPLVVKGIKIVGEMKVKEIRFITPEKSDGRHLKALVKIDIPNVVVSTPEVWAHEQGLTPDQPAASNACGKTSSGNRALDTFSGNHIWARVFGAQVLKRTKIPKNADDVIHATGLFGVTLGEPGEKGGLKLEPLGIQHDIPRVLKPYYKLQIARLQVPKISIKVDGECFDADSSGVEALFRSLLDDIKVEIVNGVSEEITTAAMEEAQEALMELDLPAGKEFKFSAKNPELNWMEPIPPTVIDKLRVARSKLLTLKEYGAVATAPKPGADPAPLAGVLYELNARLQAESLRTGNDGALEIALSDSLSVNGRKQSDVAAYASGSLPAQSPDAVRVILNRSFFEAKTDLIESLRREQMRLLPEGIALGKEGLELRPGQSGKLSLVAHLEVRLKELTGLKKAIYWLEKLAGNPDGVLKIPAQLDVEPMVTGSSGARKLVLKVVLGTNLEQNTFGQAADLGKLYPKIVEYLPSIKEKVQAKIDEAAAKLNKKPIEIDLSPLESKSPARVERVLFTDTGSLVADISLPRFPEFMKAVKVKKAARKAAELKAKEQGNG